MEIEMNTLFQKNYDGVRPLAYAMRPKTLDEYVGQEKIIGRGSVLRKLIEKGKMINSIFFGPPGSSNTISHITHSCISHITLFSKVCPPPVSTCPAQSSSSIFPISQPTLCQSAQWLHSSRIAIHGI